MPSVAVWGKKQLQAALMSKGDCKDVPTGLDTSGDSQPELNLSYPPSKAPRRDCHVSHMVSTQ